MDFQDDTDVMIPYDDDQPELSSSEITYNPAFDGPPDPRDFGVDDPYEEPRSSAPFDFQYDEEEEELETKEGEVTGRKLYKVKGAHHWMTSPEKARSVHRRLRMGSVNAKRRAKGRQPLSFKEENQEEAQGQFKTQWGPAFRRYLNDEDTVEVEQEEKRMRFTLPKKGSATEHADDCPDCFGTGMDFPRLKGDCKTCNGSSKFSKEEEQEMNVTDDPDKVARAKEARDEALAVRDKALAARDKAKQQQGDKFSTDDKERVEKDDLDVEGEGGNEEWDDPDYQGSIRTIPNAHLVHKRQQEDGTFDELWIYNIADDFKKELKIRRAILAGTDIPINKMKSPDGSQTYELWTVGNGQMLMIRGLPN
jgi:hypothetical protein